MAIRQAYVASTGLASVRVRIKSDEQAFLTIKSAAPAISRVSSCAHSVSSGLIPAAAISRARHDGDDWRGANDG